MLDTLKKCFNPGKENLLFSYLLFIVSIYTPMLVICVVILLCINKNGAEGIFKSHYTFLLRTLAIGIVLGLLFMSGIFVNIIVFSVNMMYFGAVICFVIYIWFATRMIYAIRYLLNDKAHPNPTTFNIK